MAFLNPLYLWALLGLAVPLVIHLWSRKEGRTIKIGSIQFLKESDPKQASSVKLNEIWLLLLRLLALAVLVLIIAGPVLKRDGSSNALTYLVEPSLLHHEEMRRILDTLGSGVDVRLLAKDFPAYSEEEIYEQEIPDYWQLATEMDELNSDSIAVFTAGYIAGIKGKRTETGMNINWIQIIPDENVDAPIAAIWKGNEIEVISVSGDYTRLDVKREITPLNSAEMNINEGGDSIVIDHRGKKSFIPLRTADTLRIGLFNDDELEDQTRYLRSSFRAISGYLRIPVKFRDISSEDINNEEDLLVWISKDPPKETASPVLLWRPDSLAQSLIEQGNRNDVHFLTRYLNSENIVEEHLPEQLLDILGINKDFETEIIKYDLRVMPLEEILPLTGSMDGKVDVSDTRDISKYLWMLLGILLIVERGLSVYRKQ